MFSRREILALSSIYLIVFSLLNVSRQVLTTLFPNADTGRLFFPIGVGVMRFPAPLLNLLQDLSPIFTNPRFQDVELHLTNMLIALVAILVLFIALEFIKPSSNNTKYRIYLVGIVSVVTTNAIQGFYQGFIYPVSGLRFGEKTHYFHDAEKITSAYNFLSTFNSIQPDLLTHSQTHPPGAVLIYYGFQQIVNNPIFVGFSILLISLLSVFYIYDIFERNYNEIVATTISAVFIFLPAVQIYFYSTLDALISFAVFATIYHYMRWQNNRSILHLSLLIVFLGLVMSLTFLSVLPVVILIFHQLDNKINNPKEVISDGLKVATPLIFIGFVVYLTTGFNYISAYLTASTIESAKFGGGVYAIAAPISYIITRVENISEILLFLGPFCTYLAYKGIDIQVRGIGRLVIYGILTTLFLFLLGVPRTGETARVFIFLYPLLLFPVADYIYNKNIAFSQSQQLIVLVGLQTILMQLFGSYLW
jgi:hypothetical protein